MDKKPKFIDSVLSPLGIAHERLVNLSNSKKANRMHKIILPALSGVLRPLPSRKRVREVLLKVAKSRQPNIYRMGPDGSIAREMIDPKNTKALDETADFIRSTFKIARIVFPASVQERFSETM